MYKICKTEQSAARQRELELGLLQAMESRRFEEISVSDLCNQMNIPRKSFYRYFSGKDGALFALIDHTLTEFIQVDDKRGGGNSAIGDLECFFVFWYERRALLAALERSRLSGMLLERSTSHALNEQMMPRHLLAKPQQVQRMALTFAVCGLLSMVIQWHHQGYQQSPKEMAQVATMMLTMPLISK